MKRSLSLAMAAIAVCIISLPAADRLTIVDYYRMIPDKAFKHPKFILTLKNGVYTTPSIIEEQLKPTVDIPNGYLFVEDPGTGGGTTGHACAVFIAASGVPHIALNQFAFNGVAGDSALSMFILRDGMLVDRTAECAPMISLSLFLKDPHDIKRIQSVIGKTHLYMIRTELPRYGTDIVTTLMVFSGKAELYRTADWLSSKEKAEYAAFFAMPKYETIIFSWDKKKALFIAGSKK
ncbi:MAG: hypothetical protein AABZ39_05785 [Spirochaetota bacterium]